jgi:chromosome partitioning protein
MMITVLASLKGGTGKSTVAFNLALWLSMAEQSAIVLDLDPQATLTDVSLVRREEGYTPSLTVLRALPAEHGALRANAEVLVDVGTADLGSMKQAISVADRVVVPVQPSQADIWSTQRFLRLVRESTSGTSSPDVLGFINRGDTHRAVRESDEAAAALVALPGIRYLKTRLAQRTAYRRSFSEGLAVFELEPRGKASHEFVALAAILYPKQLR